MLPHPTLDKLQTLRLTGMLKALAEQLKTPDIDSLSFVERLGLLVDRELRDDVFDYIEMFYNPKRRHSFNNQLSPVEFEKRYAASLESV
jgi:transposase InsO family protein